jgi:hypothetical protein
MAGTKRSACPNSNRLVSNESFYVILSVHQPLKIVYAACWFNRFVRSFAAFAAQDDRLL